MENILGTVFAFLVSSGLLVALIAFAKSYLVYLKCYFDIKIENMKKDSRQKDIALAVEKANDAIWSVVMQLAQETADNLKEASADGKLTKQEIEYLRDTAYARSIELMGQHSYGLLQAYTEDVKTWIYTKIDALSRETKI